MPWKYFCEHYFGPEMEQILRPQGEISAEAFNLMEEPYGMARIHIPDEWTMNREHCKCGDTIAVKYPDEDDMLYRKPFHLKHSIHRWYPRFKVQKGEYLDIHGFIDMFTRYWQLNYN